MSELTHLPPAVAERLAGKTIIQPDLDTAAERAAILRSRREASWARNCPARFKDAALTGMITTEAKAVADWYRTNTGDLLLWAETPGGGKTHTGYAILNKALADHAARVYAVTADALMDALTDAPDPDMVNEARKADYLLVDELAKASRPGWVVAKFWSLYDARYRTGQRTVFTSNAHPDAITAAYPSLMDRIREGGTLVHITHPSRRTPAVIADRLA